MLATEPGMVQQPEVLPIQVGDIVKIGELFWLVVQVLTEKIFFVEDDMTVRKFGKYHTKKIKTYHLSTEVTETWRHES